MPLRTFNPTSPARRGLIVVDRSELWAGGPEKSLVEGQHSSGGRNNHGRTTSRYRGGGVKRLYRKIDFKRNKHDIEAKVERLEYDPNRTAFIALVKYLDGELRYILAPQRLKAGDKIISGERVDVKPGNAMPMKSMPIGAIIHNVELKPGKGGQIARSAGNFAQLVGRDSGMAQVRLQSGEVRLISGECMATIGAVSNADHINEQIGKAGRQRHFGFRPHVRGIMMNPVDHPNGGRTKGGKHWATPWGKPTKGAKTRKNKRTDKFIIRSRHARKKAN
ncbi:MAG: 50S ribosomal protein L2 [Parvularculaceae bacterium]|jgi:large subunit ribosomal protein L2|nr:50S ribosomal protein L2 [Parvularculaceae bacterium]